MRSILALFLAAAALPGATRLLVTVVEQKTGRPVPGLQAADFTVTDDKTARGVEACEFTRDTLDIMLLLDTSLAGGIVQPLAGGFIDKIEAKDQMAVVAYHSSADLIQDFTSSKELIRRAIGRVKYGNTPYLLDALYAAIDGGFRNSAFRRVILLLTAGVEGRSRVTEREVVRQARRNQVSIYPVYARGNERSMLEMLARQTGGASFSARGGEIASRVFEVVRGPYTLTISGNLAPSEKLKIEVRRPEKLQISALPLE